uniref:CNNOS2 n=1 Tax=Hydra vulgaris TaxID=6087 RepID=Q9NDN9_HYDVU|nr:CNNOS2 [Hydra vulgaris]
MTMTDVYMQNFVLKNIFETDDELDLWSSSDSSNSSECSPTFFSRSAKGINDFKLYKDYSGLSNLLTNVNISDDNPLVDGDHRLSFLPRNQIYNKLSNDPEGSDVDVYSPTRDLALRSRDNNNNFPDVKQLPPSTRLSKSDRDMIISGAFQQQLSFINKHSDRSQIKMNPPLQAPPSPALVQPQQTLYNSHDSLTLRASSNVCVFCRNNGESENVYASHVLKDTDGRTSCPILRAYTCPICKANGDNSHTIKYCPMNQNARSASTFNGLSLPPSVNMAPRNTFPQPVRGNFRSPFPVNLTPRINLGAKIR